VAVIPQQKLGRDYTLLLYMMSLICPQKKKSVGIYLGLYWGQLIGPPMPIYRPGNHSSRAVDTVAQKWKL
jgi:hypothetical protein